MIARTQTTVRVKGGGHVRHLCACFMGIMSGRLMEKETVAIIGAKFSSSWLELALPPSTRTRHFALLLTDTRIRLPTRSDRIRIRNTEFKIGKPFHLPHCSSAVLNSPFLTIYSYLLFYIVLRVLIQGIHRNPKLRTDKISTSLCKTCIYYLSWCQK